MCNLLVGQGYKGSLGCITFVGINDQISLNVLRAPNYGGCLACNLLVGQGYKSGPCFITFVGIKFLKVGHDILA